MTKETAFKYQYYYKPIGTTDITEIVLIGRYNNKIYKSFLNEENLIIYIFDDNRKKFNELLKISRWGFISVYEIETSYTKTYDIVAQNIYLKIKTIIKKIDSIISK